MMWVELESTKEITGNRWIDVDIIGTGNPCITQKEFIGTVVMHPLFVWHVFAAIVEGE